MIMNTLEIIFLYIASITCFCIVSAREEIPDFEFEDNLETTTSYKRQSNRESFFTFDDFEDFGNEPEYDLFTKEKIVQRALFKAFTVEDLKYKFSEVLPLLRALSKSQRTVFASIISAQINGGKSIKFDEVKEMFGDSHSLLLPILFDLANLVREGFLRSEKYKEDKYQLLRRSLPLDRAKASAIKEIEFSPKPNSLRDDSLHVDDDKDEPETKEIQESLDGLLPDPSSLVQNSTLLSRPNAFSPQSNSARNMSLEAIENLAFTEINGTSHVKENNDSFISPMALVGLPYRRKIPYRSGPLPETCERFTGGICLNVKNYPLNDIMGSIRRHRYAMEALLAEYRDKKAELENLDHFLFSDPASDLTDLRRRTDSDGFTSPGSMCNSIIRYARPQKARSATGEWKFIVNTGEHTQTLRLEKCSQPFEPCSYLTENFESSCTQVYNYHRLLAWDNTRGLHVDIFKVPTCCSCHLVGYKEAFPPLASPSNGITSVSSSKKQPNDHDPFMTSSNQNLQYSTLNGSDAIEEDDNNDSNIAYQFGSGFKLIKPKKTKPDFQDFSEVSKNRPPLPFRNPPETFLRPPANNQESNYPFTNLASNYRRTPIFKSKPLDQNTAGSDSKISNVTVFPPKIYSQSGQSKRSQKIKPLITSTIDTTSVNLGLSNAYNTEPRRINYNYHPIIDFFEDERSKKNNLDHKTGKFTGDSNWKEPIGWTGVVGI